MSLVHDALQKAEREKLRKTGEVGPPAPVHLNVETASVPRPGTAPPRSSTAATAPALRRSVLPVIIAVCAVIIGGGIAWFILRPKPTVEGAAPAASPVATKTPVTAQLEPRPAIIPQPPPADDPAYKLTGIMRDPDGKPCAILNGRVVSVSNYVDGATVKSIEKDRVTLDVSGREVVKRLY